MRNLIVTIALSLFMIFVSYGSVANKSKRLIGTWKVTQKKLPEDDSWMPIAKEDLGIIIFYKNYTGYTTSESDPDIRFRWKVEDDKWSFF